MLDEAIKLYEAREYKKSYQLFSELAQTNSDEAQYFLGLHYYDGDGVEKNLEKAIYWFKKALKRNNVDAANMLMECDSVSTAHTNRF